MSGGDIVACILLAFLYEGIAVFSTICPLLDEQKLENSEKFAIAQFWPLILPVWFVYFLGRGFVSLIARLPTLKLKEKLEPKLLTNSEFLAQDSLEALFVTMEKEKA